MTQMDVRLVVCSLEIRGLMIALGYFTDVFLFFYLHWLIFIFSSSDPFLKRVKVAIW